MSEAIVSIENVTKRFDARAVLEDISLKIAPGEMVAIMGSSGGGKTTLLRCISGLIIPTKGQVIVDGIDVNAEPEEARRRMGMVFQSAALFDFMTVEANVLFGIKRQLKLSKTEQMKVAAEALARVGLEGNEHKMPAELSGGMRKRVGIARALALSPKVMLYDEPTTGLDPITTYTIDALMLQLRKEFGMTSLIVSHDVSSVFRTADRVAFLHGGRLVFVGTPAEFAEADDENIQELVQKSRAEKMSLDN
ncbi:ABC transporter ATP-binding protein [Fimbriimonas ginsengisoli]|uniref:ABC transporter, ATP-binding protein n=1 Tax=Fimbriimonas ginsengisoli Gsoil 348 TaxID=661478 RepID=A0A068NX76_FIMGI|nr:ATP-binding cassette domain-containing protein [Fimbriimonas ginsengisoli]AIE88031.1 ABC transporter, ATP-binding protein [Fimbriimonas ginsengisoli Gsoil 348]